MKETRFEFIRTGRSRLAAWLAVAALLTAPMARAQSTSAEPESLAKMARYGGCAVGVVVASTPAQLFTAIFNCLHMILDELGY